MANHFNAGKLELKILLNDESRMALDNAFVMYFQVVKQLL